jgi:KDO2-lipid IV(A) lauroyltransferase
MNDKTPTTTHGWSRQRLRDRAYADSLRLASGALDGVSRTVRRLPPGRRYLPADAITRPLARWWPRRPIVEANFATMLGRPAGDPLVRSLARRSVLNFGRMATDFLAVRSMSDAEVLAWVTPVGVEYLNEALSGRRGVIMALPHFGSWDVAAAYCQAAGWNLTVVTESNWVTELVARARGDHGVVLAPRDRLLRAIFRALARNECVAMLSDIAQDGLQTIEVPFFGRPAAFPMGPARLAQRTGAPIMVIGCTRLPDRTYRIEGLPPLYADPTLAQDQAVSALTAAVAAGFAHFIAACPAQWYPFHPVWPNMSAQHARPAPQ